VYGSVGMAPLLSIYTYIGVNVSNIENLLSSDFHDSWLYITLIFIGALIVAAVAFYMFRIFKRELAALLREEEGQRV